MQERSTTLEKIWLQCWFQCWFCHFLAVWPQNTVYLPGFGWPTRSTWIVLTLCQCLSSFVAFSQVFHQLNFYLFLKAPWKCPPRSPQVELTTLPLGVWNAHSSLSLRLTYFATLYFVYLFNRLRKYSFIWHNILSTCYMPRVVLVLGI